MHVHEHTHKHMLEARRKFTREHSIIIILSKMETGGGENNYYQIKTYDLQQKQQQKNIFPTKLDLDSVGTKTIRSRILLKTIYLFCLKMSVVITLEITLKVQKVNEINNSFFFLLNPTNILLNAAAVHTRHKIISSPVTFFSFSFFWGETGHFDFFFPLFLFTCSLYALYSPGD